MSLSSSVRRIQAKATEEVDADNLEEEVDYCLIDQLQSFGINATDITKLKEAGYFTAGQLLKVPTKFLLGVKGISEAKLDKIRDAARKVNGEQSFITATEVAQRQKRQLRITTGSKAFDTLLGGGLETQTITEVSGEFRTGKTQLCHTLCVTTQLPTELNGGNGKVAYVDTEGTFRPARVSEIASKRFNMEPEDVLDNIIVARAFNHESQIEAVIQLAALFADPEKGPFRLLIVDSITSLFRVDFSGRGDLAERQQKLARHLAQLLRHAEEFNIAVLLVNQVMADPGAMSMFGPVMKPVGGHVLAHAASTRLAFKKGKGEQRICKLTDSPNMPEGDVVFAITEQGIVDAD